MYDLDHDPNEAENLVAVESGEVGDPGDRAVRDELGERLAGAMHEGHTDPGWIRGSVAAVAGVTSWCQDAGGGTRTPDTRIMIPPRRLPSSMAVRRYAC